MAALNTIAREYADEIRDGIAWVIVWKTGRSWHASSFWLNTEDDTFEIYDLDEVREILAADPHAVMVNGYYCGHFGEDMTVAELADGIRWHYKNGCNRLEGSTAFPPEPIERPADLPSDMAWYGRETTGEPDPYIFDGYMSVEDHEKVIDKLAADKTDNGNETDSPYGWIGEIRKKEAPAAIIPWRLFMDEKLIESPIQSMNLSEISPPHIEAPKVRAPDSMELTLTIEPETAAAIANTIHSTVERVAAKLRQIWEAIGQKFRQAAAIADNRVSEFMDALLYQANDNPKWWHLYKHAKKYRTRKKYKRRLMQQLQVKLAAAGT